MRVYEHLYVIVFSPYWKLFTYTLNRDIHREVSYFEKAKHEILMTLNYPLSLKAKHRPRMSTVFNPLTQFQILQWILYLSPPNVDFSCVSLPTFDLFLNFHNMFDVLVPFCARNMQINAMYLRHWPWTPANKNWMTCRYEYGCSMLCDHIVAQCFISNNR
jgi:hypothetical protein